MAQISKEGGEGEASSLPLVQNNLKSEYLKLGLRNVSGTSELLDKHQTVQKREF